jgi:hypothetical protein
LEQQTRTEARAVIEFVKKAGGGRAWVLTFTSPCLVQLNSRAVMSLVRRLL